MCLGAAASILFLAPIAAQSQFEILKKAKQTLEERLPSVESLFGNGPVITTNIEDAHDGVALLDGFTPKKYSPLLEMPHTEDATLFLVPGAYAGMLQSFCLKPGTYGPQKGDGYLHAEWEGPKADLISSIITRWSERRDIPQWDVQRLLWAIIAHVDLKDSYRDVQTTAARLLTPQEILELNGLSLKVVPGALSKRVLEKTPSAVREILEAENEMRRLFASGETKYSDLEQVAVKTGVMPESDSRYQVPRGRWSYHPAGFFIRYNPQGYSLIRVDIYYPDKVELRRDGEGRIISIASSSGRHVEPQHPARATVQLVSSFRAPMSRVDLLVRAMKSVPGDARPDLLMLAYADYMDLAAIHHELEIAPVSLDRNSAEKKDLVQNAMHSALARFIGISRLKSVERGGELEASLRPRLTLDGFTYTIEPVAVRKSTMARVESGYGPGGGGAVAPGWRQRLGPSLGMVGPPPAMWEGPNGDKPDDSIDKAQKSIDMMNAMNDVKDFFSGGWLDKAAMGANKSQEKAFGAAASPGAMLGAGMEQGFNAARGIGNAMAGDDGSWLPGLTRGHDVATTRTTESMIVPVSFTPMRMIGTNIEPRASGMDYRILSKPRTISFRPFTSAQYPAQAQIANAVVTSSFRTAMLLEAWELAQRRFNLAVKARDQEWQEKQGLALIHLQHVTGLAMIKFSEDLGAFTSTTSVVAILTQDEVRDAQTRLKADGYGPDMIDIARQLGMTGAELEARRQRVLALTPQEVSGNYQHHMEILQSAMLRYGKHLALMPDIAPPWD